MDSSQGNGKDRTGLVSVKNGSMRNHQILVAVAFIVFGLSIVVLSIFILLATRSIPFEGLGIKIDIEKDEYGKTSNDEPVQRYTLRNSNGMEVEVITYGGTIASIRVPDRDGVIEDVVLGSDDTRGFESTPYFGSLVGRVANRIANAQFTLDGEQYRLDANDGQNHLHGGVQGWSKNVWDAQVEDGHLLLSYLSPDGDGGYPGEVMVNVTMELTEDNQLIINYTAEVTKAATPIGLTSHPYFNLGGHDSGPIYDHEVTIFADRYLPVSENLIPTGIETVEGSIFDLRSPHRLGNVLHNVTGGGYDHNFCVRGPTGKRMAARVVHPPSGRILTVYTNQPGVQFYTGNFLNVQPGKDGAIYNKHGGFCLETQNYPDAINHPNFPDSVLRPGSLYLHTVWYKFGTDKE